MFDLQGFGHLFISGAWVTIKLALASLAVGLCLGLMGALAKLSRYAPLRFLATTYTSVMRGIPELLLVLFIYFGASHILMAIASLFGYSEYIELNKFVAGVTALSIAFGAYATETFRMAIQEIPQGQWEAAQAVGMTKRQTLTRIIMPQMWRIALPGLGNLFLVLLKDTALVSVIGLNDIMRQAHVGSGSTGKPFTFYMAAALIYLAFTVVVTVLMTWFERKANPAKYAQANPDDVVKMHNAMTG